MPSADGHPPLHPRYDRPRPHVPQRVPRVLIPAPLPGAAGFRGALRAPRGAQLRPLAPLRPQHLALRRHRLLRRALPQGKTSPRQPLPLVTMETLEEYWRYFSFYIDG